MAKPIRTFVAIELSDEIRRRAVELQRALDRACGIGVTPAPGEANDRVKWVEAENIHLTLQFLGNVPDHEIADVCTVAQRAAAGATAFELTVEAAGAFPNLRRPRTVWLGVSSGSEAVTALYKSLEDGLVPLGFRREKRRFHPHVTIGRVRGRPGTLGECLEAQRDWSAGSMVVREVVVMASELASDGPRYNVMGRAPLGATT